MELREFIEARLAEDEAGARAAGGQSWRCGVYGYDERQILDEDRDIVVYDEGSPTDGQAAHIARHDPARVLRDVEASRRLLTFAQVLDDDGHQGSYVLAVLAARWLDHLDYDPSWSTT